MIEVSEVRQGSAASRTSIVPGDRIASVNGRPVRDCIDLQFLAAGKRFKLGIRRSDGSSSVIQVQRRQDEPLGLGFAPFPVRRCRNRCLFCFVDQMPKGCRPSLSVKDDDYRASFLFGNYITLGNLRDEDWDRIFEQRLSPLYISVHASEPDVRSILLNNRTAPDIMMQMKRLAGGGIRMHAQIVLCPGLNDGIHLERTVNDLAELYPAVQSIAVVPVGLTGHRKDLPPLRTCRPSEARKIIDALTLMGRGLRRRIGTRLVYPSDELYIKADRTFPHSAFYEDYPQLENGVGMVSLFLQEAKRTGIPRRIPPVRITAITGTSFSRVLRTAVGRFMAVPGVQVRVVTVRNSFFGPSVTVAGLLTGRDIRRAISGRRLGSRLLVPAAALKDDEGIFLDDLPLKELERAAGVPVVPVRGFRDIVEALRAAAGGIRA